MNYRRQILLLVLISTIFFIFPSLTQAGPLWGWLKNLEITIVPRKSDSYQGTYEEFLHEPSYVQGEQVTFDISLRFKLFLRFQWGIDLGLSNKFILSTFPDSKTKVRLGHISKGRYSYTSPSLTRIGNKNHTLRIALVCPFWWGKNCPIIIAQAQRSISVLPKPLNIETPVAKGEYPVIVTAEDEFGTTDSDSTAVTSNPIPPQNPFVSIDEGDYTNNPNISISLSVENAVEMIISENQDFADAEWEPYKTARLFTLSPGDGAKRVYVKYRNQLLAETDPVSDSITLDKTPPRLEITSPVEGFTTHETKIAATGTFTELNLDRIMVNNLPATIIGHTFTTENFSLSEEEETIIIKARDLAGNTTTVIIKIKVVLETAPLTPSIIEREGNYKGNFIVLQGTVGTVTGSNIGTVIGNDSKALIQADTSIVENLQLKNEDNNPIIAVEDIVNNQDSYEISEGINNTSVTTEDKAGNSSTPSTTSIAYDDSSNLTYNYIDSDGDGIYNIFDINPQDNLILEDIDRDGVDNLSDGDDDNDGVLDIEDDFPYNDAKFQRKHKFLICVSMPTAWDKENAWNSFINNLDVIDVVNTSWYELQTDGTIRLAGGNIGVVNQLISITNDNNISLMPYLTNYINSMGDFSAEHVSRIINDPALTTAHIQNVVNEVLKWGYEGINIDYESCYAKDRSAFTNFIRNLSAALHNKGKMLAVSLHPKTSEPGDWYGTISQDWEALAPVIDFFHVMTYDYSWSTSPPGPIAPVEWIRDVTDFALGIVNSEKLIMGVPFYGYDWSGSMGDGKTWLEIQEIIDIYNIIPDWDYIAKELYFTYNGNHTVYYQDSESISYKLDVFYNSGVKGISIWRIGSEDPENWSEIRDIL